MACVSRSTRNKYRSAIGAAAILTAAAPSSSLAADVVSAAAMQERYARAEALLPWNIERELYGLTLKPRWLDSGSRFEYSDAHRDGVHFYAVDPVAGSRTRITSAGNEPADDGVL